MNRCAARALALVTVVWPLAAGAQSGAPGPEDRTWIHLSGGAATMHTVMADSLYQPLNGISSRVDAENDLGVSRRGTVAGLGFGRRIGQAWRLEVDLSRERRHGSTTLSQDTHLDGTTFVAGSTLATDLSLNVLRVNGGWSLLQRDGVEAGVLFGGQWLTLKRGMDGIGYYDFTTSTSAQPIQTSGRDDAPMPILGAFGVVTLAPALRLSMRAEFAPGGDYTLLAASVLWHATPNLALGLGYRAVEANADISWGLIQTEIAQFQLDYRQRGPQLFVQASF